MIKTVKIFLIASLNMFFLCSCQTGHTDQSMAAQIIKHKQQDQDARGKAHCESHDIDQRIGLPAPYVAQGNL